MNNTNTNVEVINDTDSAVFDFSDEGFNIIYENEEWIAEPINEDDETIIIIESEKEDIWFDDQLELFGGYDLTEENFNKLKQAVLDAE